MDNIQKTGLASVFLISLISIFATTEVFAQYGLDWNTMDCAEKRGAIKVITAMVYGGMLGTEEHDVDPFIQQMFNKLTRLLLEAQQDYNANC